MSSGRNYYNNDHNQSSNGAGGNTPISNGNGVPHRSYNTSTPTKSILKRNNNTHSNDYNNNNNNTSDGGYEEQQSSWYGGESAALGSRSAAGSGYGKSYDEGSGARKAPADDVREFFNFKIIFFFKNFYNFLQGVHLGTIFFKLFYLKY